MTGRPSPIGLVGGARCLSKYSTTQYLVEVAENNGHDVKAWTQEGEEEGCN